MDHRIRSAMKQNKGELFGTVEADETYIGGKRKGEAWRVGLRVKDPGHWRLGTRWQDCR